MVGHEPSNPRSRPSPGSNWILLVGRARACRWVGLSLTSMSEGSIQASLFRGENGSSKTESGLHWDGLEICFQIGNEVSTRLLEDGH